MFNMPITFGVERSTSLPPAFMLMHYHYAVGNDIDVDFRLGDFGDFFAVFACIFSKMLLLRYRNLPYLGLTFEYNGFAYDRSEEHTSELQSLMRISYAVFCLKKKKTNNKYNMKAL